MALGKSVIVLGRPENVFHWHPLVVVVDDEAAILRHLDTLQRETPARTASVE